MTEFEHLYYRAGDNHQVQIAAVENVKGKKGWKLVLSPQLKLEVVNSSQRNAVDKHPHAGVMHSTPMPLLSDDMKAKAKQKAKERIERGIASVSVPQYRKGKDVRVAGVVVALASLPTAVTQAVAWSTTSWMNMLQISLMVYASVISFQTTVGMDRMKRWAHIGLGWVNGMWSFGASRYAEFEHLYNAFEYMAEVINERFDAGVDGFSLLILCLLVLFLLCVGVLHYERIAEFFGYELGGGAEVCIPSTDPPLTPGPTPLTSPRYGASSSEAWRSMVAANDRLTARLDQAEAQIRLERMMREHMQGASGGSDSLCDSSPLGIERMKGRFLAFEKQVRENQSPDAAPAPAVPTVSTPAPAAGG